MKMWPWLIAALGIAVLSRDNTSKSANFISKPKTRSDVEKKYGVLRPGIDYTEASKGYINISKSWKDAHLTKVVLEDGDIIVDINKVIANEFLVLWEAAKSAAGGWAPSKVMTEQPRHILNDPARRLSLHSYGIAFDVDPSDNPRLGKHGTIDQHQAWIDTWVNAGWSWGGNWKDADRDEMHFQAASGDA